METNTVEVEQTITKDKELKDENWHEYGSDAEQEDKEKKSDVPKEPKKVLLKDKFGEIIINKLETYVEPTKGVKEARGDNRMANRYDFGDLSFDSDDEEEEADEDHEEVEYEEETKKKHKAQNKKITNEDLDDIFKDLGIEVKTETVKKENKPKKVKKEVPATTTTGENTNEEAKTEETKEAKKKKKKPAAADKTKKTSHVNELKRELIERKEALKKKEKKKGI
jgi:hypothetical protein